MGTSPVSGGRSVRSSLAFPGSSQATLIIKPSLGHDKQSILVQVGIVACCDLLAAFPVAMVAAQDGSVPVTSRRFPAVHVSVGSTGNGNGVCANAQTAKVAIKVRHLAALILVYCAKHSRKG